MSMFKKPKRQFRALRTRGSDSDEDGKDNGDSTPNNQGDIRYDSTVQPMEVEPKKRTSKKKEKSQKSGSAASLSSLSFATHDEDGEGASEIFRVKKSSRSQRIAKQLKKESRKEKEDREKREAEEQKRQYKYVDTEDISNGKAVADMDLDSDNEGPKPELCPSYPSPEDDDASADEENGDGSRRRFGRGKDFTSVLQSGQIPDANMIHLARKRRQMAREAGDFVALEDEIKQDKNAARLIREEDHDRSDSDDEPVLMTGVRNKEVELRSRQNKFYEAEQGSGEESDHDNREWEEQQIRKGVSIPQVVPPAKVPTGDDLIGFQYSYGQTSNIFNPNAPPAFSAGGGFGASVAPGLGMPSGGLGVQIGTNIPNELPLINMEQITKRLSERLESLGSLHRAHCNEKDDMENRLIMSDDNIAKYEGGIRDSEEQYKFFQEMRGYVRDLVECLNEKVPQVTYMERCMLHLMKNRASKLVQRRQDDIKDQSQDFMSKKALAGPNLVSGSNPQDMEKQRRVAEREARRSRRRRAREARGIKDHFEGMSSDDEVSQSDLHKYSKEKERLTYDSRTLFEDVVEDFAKINRIKSRFESWRRQQTETYQEAYISLCLPKLFTPLVRQNLITWNPMQEGCPDFEETSWYESLMFFGYREGEEMDSEDCDIKLVPSIIEKVLLPKLTDLVENVWDPLSTSQTTRLSKCIKKLIRDYPSVSADSKNTQILVKAIATRMRKTLDDDVFMPLYPKPMLENRNSGASLFFQRQFWTCVKLLNNFLQWHDVLADTMLKELSLDGLLNRYMMLALQYSPLGQDTLYKCQVIISTFPKPWFSELDTDSSLPQLEMMCRFLISAALQLDKHTSENKEMERKESRELLRQICKLLVNIHALDHAQTLAEQFSLKL